MNCGLINLHSLLSLGWLEMCLYTFHAYSILCKRGFRMGKFRLALLNIFFFFLSSQIIFEISLLQAVLLTQYVCVCVGGGLSLAGTAPSIIFVTTKPCHDKHVFVMTTHVFCCNKSILVTVNFGSNRHISVMTNLCDDKMYRDKNDTYGSSHQ